MVNVLVVHLIVLEAVQEHVRINVLDVKEDVWDVRVVVILDVQHVLGHVMDGVIMVVPKIV